MLRSFLLSLTLLSTLSCSVQDAADFVQFQEAKIVGGELVDKNEFKGVVALVRGGDIICSGVVIDKRTILTAAHCLVGQNVYALSILVGRGTKLPHPGKVVKGQYRIDGYELFPTLRYTNFHGITNYGEFNANDIGIITTQKNLVNIQPYQVLTKTDLIKEKVKKGEKIVVVGYGYTGEDRNFGFGFTESHVEYGLKRKVEIPIVGVNNHEIDARADGLDSCYVDSGAPAFVKTDQGYKIAGLVSGSDGLCGENEFPAYYSLVYDSACWINQYTGMPFDDLDFHCERHERISKACSVNEDPKEAKLCAKELSDEIFSNL